MLDTLITIALFLMGAVMIHDAVDVKNKIWRAFFGLVGVICIYLGVVMVTLFVGGWLP